MGMKWSDVQCGLASGDQLYSHRIRDPGFVKMWMPSVSWLEVGQARPRFEGVVMFVVVQVGRWKEKVEG